MCTVVATNYLAQAMALEESLSKSNPDLDFFLLVVDLEENSIELQFNSTLFKVQDLAIAEEIVKDMRAYYDLYEFCTAIKPTFIRHVLDLGFDTVTFLDPDVQVFSEIKPWSAIEGDHDLLLTPHRLSPVPNGAINLNEATFLKYGVFNLGFICVTKNGRSFLNWWESRLRWACRRDETEVVFTDQKWIDLAPGFFNAGIIRHPGYNVAPWNIDERELKEVAPDIFFAGTSPLVFMHFSQMSTQLLRGLEVTHWEKYSEGMDLPQRALEITQGLSYKYAKKLRFYEDKIKALNLHVLTWNNWSFQYRRFLIARSREGIKSNSKVNRCLYNSVAFVLRTLNPVIRIFERTHLYSSVVAGFSQDFRRIKVKLARKVLSTK